MPRPSKHTDQLLIRAARKIYPRTGYSALSLREVAAKASVNLGMFHYYFKTKEEFVRRVLQEFYEEFFKDFNLDNSRGSTSLEKLRSGLIVVAKFNRDNRAFMAALIADLMNGEKVVVEFVRANLSRHGSVLFQLILDCQNEKLIEKMSPFQIIALMMAAINFPTFLSTFIDKHSRITKKKMLERQESLVNDKALIQRVDIVLKGLSRQKRGAS